MPIQEFLDLLRSQLPIQDATVVGFKDNEGVLLIPSIVCTEPDILGEEYELIIKEKQVVNVRPTSASIRTTEEHLSHVITDIRVRNLITEEEYFNLRMLIRDKDEEILQAFGKYQVDYKIENLHDTLVRRVKKPMPRRRSISGNIAIEIDNIPRRSSRDRPRTARRTQETYLQVAVDMEQQGLLDERILGAVKTLILEENSEVLREIEKYFAQEVQMDALARTLNRMTDRLSHYIERPQSPRPKKNELMLLVNTVVKDQLPDPDDLQVLKKLIVDENEFVFAAFDVFVSDRDEEELLDTLMRWVLKAKRVRLEETEALNTSSFYPSPKASPRASPTIPQDEVQEEEEECEIDLEQLIEQEKLEEYLTSEEIGMMIELLNTSPGTISHIFDNYFAERDIQKLVSMIKMIWGYNLENMLRHHFTEEQVSFIQNMASVPNEEIAIIMQVFRYEYSVENLVNNLKSVVKDDHIAASSRATTSQMPKDINYKKDIDRFAQHSFPIKCYKLTFYEKIDEGDEMVLRIIRGYNRSKNMDISIAKLEELIPYNDAEEFAEFVSKKIPERANSLIEMYEENAEAILLAWNGYKESDNKGELVEQLNNLLNGITGEMGRISPIRREKFNNS